MRFNGICIVTQNVNRLCAFYREILRLEPEEGDVFIDLCIFKGIVIYSFICDLKVVPIGWNIVVHGRLSCLMKATASTK